MASCKDCLNFEVCKDRLGTTKYYDNVIAADNVEKLCPNFKDRNRFVELPCKVGDTVYILEYEDGEAVDCSGWIFLMANNDFALLSPTVNGESHPIGICNFYFERYAESDEHPDFVVIVPLNEIYITKEEAEKALNNPAKSDS